MALGRVSVEFEPPRLTIVLNHPGSRNAIDTTVLGDLEAAVDRAQSESSIRIVLIRSAVEGAFSAGADLKAFEALSPNDTQDYFEHGQAVLRAIERSVKPVVAVVDGYALGGGFELCLATSFIVATDRARFGLPEGTLGLIPGFGGTQRLTRLIGRQRALHLMLTGQLVDASEALALGIAASVVPSNELDTHVDALCSSLSRCSPRAHRAILELVDGAFPSLDAGLERETKLALEARNSNDGVEGIAAFLSRRAPVYNGLSQP